MPSRGEGHRQQERAAWAQASLPFSEECLHVKDVLQHLRAEDHVRSAVFHGPSIALEVHRARYRIAEMLPGTNGVDSTIPSSGRKQPSEGLRAATNIDDGPAEARQQAGEIAPDRGLLYVEEPADRRKGARGRRPSAGKRGRAPELTPGGGDVATFELRIRGRCGVG
jgi:hypothetical protein